MHVLYELHDWPRVFYVRNKDVYYCQFKFLCETNENSFLQQIWTFLVCTAANQGHICVSIPSISRDGKRNKKSLVAVMCHCSTIFANAHFCEWFCKFYIKSVTYSTWNKLSLKFNKTAFLIKICLLARKSKLSWKSVWLMLIAKTIRTYKYILGY